MFGMDFNMLLSEDSSLSISFSKTLVVVLAFSITSLASKGNDNRSNLNVMLIIVIRTGEIYV